MAGRQDPGHVVTEVRIASAPHNGMERYVGCFGEVVGFSGQFVKVRITSDVMGNKRNDRHCHLFLPGELSTR